MIVKYQKSLVKNKSSLVLMITMLVAVIVACVMFVNKEALAEESVIPNEQTPLEVVPSSETSNVERVSDGGKGSLDAAPFYVSTKYTDPNYLITIENSDSSKSFQYEYKYNGSDKISNWKIWYRTYLTTPSDFIASYGANRKVIRPTGSGSGGCVSPEKIVAYIGTDHYYEPYVEGGEFYVPDSPYGFGSNDVTEFTAPYGDQKNDLSLAYSSYDNFEYVDYYTGENGGHVVCRIYPNFAYTFDKLELRAATPDEELIATVSAEDPVKQNLNEVADKLVPVFKKMENCINVYGKVFNNVLEPFIGAEIYEVSDDSNWLFAAKIDSEGKFIFPYPKGEAHKFAIIDPNDRSTIDVFEISADQSIEDVNVGTFYLVPGAKTEIPTTGEGFDGIHVIAEKDGTVYYDGPFYVDDIVLGEGGELSVDENGNLIYKYSYTDETGEHNYLLTFTPNASDGYHVDSWMINDNIIKFGDDPYVITSDDVDNGLKTEPVMAANPIDPDDPVIPVEEVNATAQTGDNHIARIFGLTTVIALAGACALRFRKEN